MRNVVKWAGGMFIPSQKNLWKPRIFMPKNLFGLAVVLLIIKFIVFSWLAYSPQTSNFAVVTSSELIEMTNQARIEQGLEPLTVSSKLSEAAEKKAMDMINQNYFSHTSPDGLSPWYWVSNAGYKYSTAGENLAKDFSESEYVHQAWMNSPSHKANILNKNYQDIGVAVLRGNINGRETTVAVQFFGKIIATKTVATTTKTTTKKTAVAPKPVIVPDANKIEIPVVVSNVQGEEVELLKGSEILQERGVVNAIVEESKNVFDNVVKNPEPWTQKFYMIVLGLISLILILSIFINVRVQYPKMILMVVIFIILITAITSFNGEALLNSGIDII
ncbi:MAG: CAP domain-containing protein [Candidatus Portnoybacteria bacterium]|nr:CAP domain-containing protein [Candidatus Portnoybacteria bacterium]